MEKKSQTGQLTLYEEKQRFKVQNNEVLRQLR
jgi:hypothetical protein